MASQTPKDSSSTPTLTQDTPQPTRRQSSSQESEDSQTAAEFLRNQMQLEADAREALPYSIEHCTKPLGRLRQSVFACLTCNPPPKDPNEPYNHPAGVCYACSVQCHGEHTLVEIFTKRNFSCDCGTTRFSDTSPCSLRVDAATNSKGGVHGEAADPENKYNHNFRNRFCGCACDYDPFQQKGTMFQCLGLGTHETGGCGEDWWHPGCVVGLGPDWFEHAPATEEKKSVIPRESDALPTISEDEGAPAVEAAEDEEDEEEPPMPPGFPKEDEFEGFICYKCVEAHPWIKRYAGAPGFLPAVFFNEKGAGEGEKEGTETEKKQEKEKEETEGKEKENKAPETAETTSKKRKAEDEDDSQETKRARGEEEDKTDGNAVKKPVCKLASLPPPPTGKLSLFFTESFRDHLCRCDDCFPLLKPYPQLLEEEETYEPPVSVDGDSAAGAGAGTTGAGSDSGGGGPSHGSGSLYDRGESALRNIDRVRAIEGVMAYNQLKDKLKPFFQQFADSGQAISAEDIKAYFAKLRGDSEAIREAGEAAKSADFRRGQSGY